MDNCPEDRSLYWLDRETQKRLCRQGQEVLQRAQTRAVNWCSLAEDLRGEGEAMGLDTAFKTVMEYMDYVSSQCGKFHALAPEKVALNHVCRYHRNQLNPSPYQSRQEKSTSHDPRESYQVTKIGPGLSRFDPGPSKFDSGPSRFDPASSRFDPRPSRFDPGSSEFGPGPSKSVARTSSQDITIEVYPGTYAVTVGSPDVTTTHMVEVDSGQIIDLSFPL
ncbi:A-kinase-interacting protein 1-like [Dromiciops gliroides]|uniref:A-kinase-interacting protein 1-like n=1 Tax=Dromiciops gliroides TaxID=33562 RepID=UPI001CC61961|nr:A-kinase-interacting protein 1-like [Dromiciops gliroides]